MTIGPAEEQPAEAFRSSTGWPNLGGYDDNPTEKEPPAMSATTYRIANATASLMIAAAVAGLFYAVCFALFQTR